MPDPTNNGQPVPLPANEKVRTSERIWSAEVGAADASDEDKTAYVFGNNRKFTEGRGPYGQ